MSLGAGLSAAGLSPCGTGDVDVAPAPTKNLLVDALGARQNARYLNPATGRYEFDATGAIKGMSAVQQMVYLRVKTALNSSALQGFGSNTTDIPVIGPDLQRRVETRVRNALADIVTSGFISIDKITVSLLSSTGVRATVLWRDLTNADPSKPGASKAQQTTTV